MGRLTFSGCASCTVCRLPRHLHLLLTMATLLPPPKRQKVYHGVPEPEPEPAKPSPHIVVQFVSEDDGQPLAPAVNLPANVSREGLEAIVNKLNTKVCFSFQHQRPMPRSRPGLSKSRLDQYGICVRSTPYGPHTNIRRRGSTSYLNAACTVCPSVAKAL